MKRRTIITVALPVTALIVGLILYLCYDLDNNRFSVTSTGPLDIRLWGIRPGAGDTIYDPNGNKIMDTFGLARGDIRVRQKQQRYDFLFELPDTNEIPVFVRYRSGHIEASGDKVFLDGDSSHRLLDHKGRKLLWLSTALDRTFEKKIFFGLRTVQVTAERVDITLGYHHGPSENAVCVFQGPFRLGRKHVDQTGLYNISFAPAPGLRLSGHLYFEVNAERAIAAKMPALIYSVYGGRRRVDADSISHGPAGTNLKYKVVGPSLREITMITVGDEPFETVFRNVRLDVIPAPPAPPDPMRRQNRAEYRSGEAAIEAIETADIVRDGEIPRTATVIVGAVKSEAISEQELLGGGRGQLLKSAALAWTEAVDPEIRAHAVKVGLQFRWPEFVEPAFQLLDYPAAYDNHSASEARNMAVGALATYADNLSDEAINRIRQMALQPQRPGRHRGLINCLRYSKSQASVEALRALAQDDRPWLWWHAVNELAQRGKFRNKEDLLPEKLKLRLFLVSGPDNFSTPNQIAPRACRLLTQLLTPDLHLHDHSVFYLLLWRLDKHMDSEAATKVVIAFLRTAEQYRRSTAVYKWCVKFINRWNALDIAGLGADFSRETSQASGRHWPTIVTETIQWYDAVHSSADPNAAQ